MRRIKAGTAGLTLALFLMACGNAAPGDAQSGAEEEAPEAEAHEIPAAVGTWERQATYTAGDLVGENPATLVITETTFSSSSPQCSNSGSLELEPDSMVMTVEQSSCPSIITVGSSLGYAYTVEGDRLTISNTDYGAEVREVYARQR